MAREEKSKEAPVHFELFRLIRNNMDKCNSDVLRYKDVAPECSVGNGAADLVVYAEIDNGTKPFFAIEVKRPTERSFLLYDKESELQIRNYATILSTPYFALTDGDVFRLFTADGKVGDYMMKLADEQVVEILTKLQASVKGKLELNLPKAPEFNTIAFEKELEEIAKTLTNVFQQLGQEEKFKVRTDEKRTAHMLKLSFDSLKDVLRLAVEREKSLTKGKSYIDVRLTYLRRYLGTEALRELLVKLGQIQYFHWIDPNKAFGSDPNTWKDLRDASNGEKPQSDRLKKDLTDWFLTISKLLEKHKHE